MLETIQISNFKSIANESVPFGDFNVLIGANAAGKSNFVDALRFIYDILNDGISSAVGYRLGWENVLTREKKLSEKIIVEIFYTFKGNKQELKIEEKTYKPINIRYKLEIGYRAKKFNIYLETLKAKFKYNDNEIVESFNRKRRNIRISDSIIMGKQPKFRYLPKQFEDKLYLTTGFLSIGSILLNNLIDDWHFYSLDVNAARKPSIDESQEFLLYDGHNLASILEKVSKDSSYKRILKLMSILIPNFETWKTDKQFDGSTGFKIFEKGITKGLLPKMVSDGTIRLLCILLTLLYKSTEAELICIDEPERYLHPQVLQTLVEIMRDISKKTQLIITTHSTKLVKWLKPSEVFMVDKKNNTTHIVRAQDVSMIDEFLKELSLDELWLGGYLKGGKIL